MAKTGFQISHAKNGEGKYYCYSCGASLGRKRLENERICNACKKEEIFL
jgi:hypothetical protein